MMIIWFISIIFSFDFFFPLQRLPPPHLSLLETTCEYSIVTKNNLETSSFIGNKWLLDMQMKAGISVPQKFDATGNTTSAVGEAYLGRLDRYKL